MPAKEAEATRREVPAQPDCQAAGIASSCDSVDDGVMEPGDWDRTDLARTQ